MKRRGIGYGATVALAAGVFLAGWEQQHPEPRLSVGCEAVDSRGLKQQGVAYPVGQVAVKYQERRPLGNTADTMPATIMAQGDNHKLRLHEPLPDRLANDYLGYRQTDVVIAVETLSHGEVGITEQCFSRQVHQLIDLPE